ncbi:MAG: asparagine synthase [Ignavibacteria bacterium]|nr:asparagine synthase [Ignavibacteria bacterium]
MCGIAGTLKLDYQEIPALGESLEAMNQLIAHRGPDGSGTWMHDNRYVGLTHRRLTIIDLKTGDQPMKDRYGNIIVYNGELYNYVELREELRKDYDFLTTSDTEVILAAYRKWGAECLNKFRGMFAFAIWDEKFKVLFCARDRFGIKPFYYTHEGNGFYFASEPKAMLPFLSKIQTDTDALKDYLVFQLYLDGKTLFKNINELQPGHYLIIKNGSIQVTRYWEVYYNHDWEHTPKYFYEHLQELIEDSIKFHLRSDVPVGSYLSGGVDSGIVSSIAARLQTDSEFKAFHGKFELGELYDESLYARDIAEMRNISLYEKAITSKDFIDNIGKVIFHLDYPVAGPGSFPQYMVSQLASQHLKVVLGGQGGDEIFGGYVRYLIAYFEQCIKGAIEGTLHSGNFVVTYESIIPNLTFLKNYKPLMKDFWRDGLFEDIDRRYYHLINRAPSLEKEVNWNELGTYSSFDTFRKIFNGENVGKQAYFDKMTHFDFKTLLPGLLQVEDRMSMADSPIVEFAASIPSDVKFKNGTLKMTLINAMKHELPDSVVQRKNKMGFPVPLNTWLKTDLKDFIFDLFNSQSIKDRPYFNKEEILKGIGVESEFGRKVWGLLSLELWHREFIDKADYYKNLPNNINLNKG